MRPEVKSNRFEISLRGKISLWCKVTLLLTFTWFQAKWNSLRCKFHFGYFTLLYCCCISSSFHISIIWDHPRSTYAKFSEKLTFLITWYVCAYLLFGKIVRTFWLNDRYLKNISHFNFIGKLNVFVETIQHCYYVFNWPSFDETNSVIELKSRNLYYA